jgi:hypothetical protein
LHTDLTNLPISLKKIYFKKEININKYNIKLPFGCEVIYY